MGTCFTQHEGECELETDLNKRIMERKGTSIDVSRVTLHQVAGVWDM